MSHHPGTDLPTILSDTALPEAGSSHRQYENLLDAVNGIVWEADAATMTFTFVSDKAEKLVGYPTRRWLEEPTFWVDHLHPDDREWAMQYCVDAAAARRDHELEYRMIAANGRTIWLRETVTVDAREGEPVRLRGVLVDITRQKENERELHRRDAILEAVRFAGERLLAPAGDWSDGVHEVLERLGIATGVSRVYIFENYLGPDGETLATNTHEWVSSPELSVIDRPQLQAFSYRDLHLGRWLDLLPRGEIIHGHVRDMPEEERAEFQDEGTLSFVLVPVFVDGSWWGFIGFDECVQERTSSKIERDALKAAADMLGAAIARERELRRRDAVLDAVRFAGESFLARTRSWEDSVDQVLERLGNATGVSRVYIYENFDGPDGEIWASKKYWWVLPELAEQIPVSTRAEFSYVDMGLQRWIDAAGRGEVLHGLYRDLPAEERERSGPRRMTIAYVLVPVYVEGSWWGYIQFNECVQERTFSAMERDALKAAADTLGAAISRNRAEELSSRLAAIVESSDDAIIGEALDGTINSWNTGAERLYGYRSDEIIGRPIDILLPPGEAPRLPDVLLAADKGELLGHFETQRLRRDGTPVDVSIAFSPIRDTWGAIIGAAAITRDISREKQARRELRESQRSMQTLLSNLPGMAYRCRNEPDWPMEFVSEGSVELTGYRPEHLVSNRDVTYADLIHPEDRANVWNDVQAAVAMDQPFRTIYRIIAADGEVKWVLEQGRGMRGRDGGVDALEGIITDVTERVRAIEELRENQRSMQTLLSNLPGMAYRSLPGMPWQVDFVSEGALELTGFEPADLVNNYQRSFVDLIHPEDRGALRHDIEAAVISRQPFHLTYRITTASGAEKWVMDQGRPIHDGDGELVALEGIITDITDRIASRQLLEQRVEERTRELGTLLEIGRNVAATLELEPLLGLILDEVRATMEYHGAGILILHDDELVQAAGRGPSPERIEEGVRVKLANARLIREMLERGEPRVIGDVWSDDRLARDYRRAMTEDWLRERPYVRSWAGVPLQIRNRTLGMMVITYAEPNHFTGRHVEMLTAVAAQAAVAIENARLYEEAQGKAALEERQRLARELHDSVSQALFGIGLGARTARTLIDQDPARAVAPIDYVLSLAEAGLAEMRALIFELRPDALEQEGLVAALEKQVAALTSRYAIEVEATLPERVQVRPQVQEAIYRIAQEALHNVVKHARATKVALVLEDRHGEIALRIEDNGKGFDATGSFPGHLGLKSMGERAEKLDGTFIVESAPGHGASIQVSIPTGGP